MSSFEGFFGKHAAVSKQLAWEHLIYQVSVLFAEAERRIRSPEGQERYPKLAGWWRGQAQRLNGKNGCRIPEETAVSEAIVDEMEKAKLDLMLDASRFGPDFADIDLLEFSAEVPRRKKTGIGRRAKPTDFRFYRSGLGDIELRIEAKVVVKDSDVRKHYLSDKGLGRFSDPLEPYTDELVGGMVAYTVTEDRQAWIAKIETNMVDASISKFEYSLPQTGDKILCSEVPYNHTTPQHSHVLVFHLVLEMDTDPPAR